MDQPAADAGMSGRTTPTGQTAASGQFEENQAIALSNLAVWRSLPFSINESFLPSLKTIVETRDADSPVVSQYAAATARICWVIGSGAKTGFVMVNVMRVCTRICQDDCGEIPSNSFHLSAGILPHMAKHSPAQVVLDRIDRRKKELGIKSDRALSVAATGSEFTLASIRKQVRMGRQQNINSGTLTLFADALKTSVQQLLTGGDAGPGHIESGHILNDSDHPGVRGRTVPLVGYVGAGAAAHFYAVAQGHLEEVAAPEDATEQTVACEIRGISLGKVFDRWLVFYDDVHSPITDNLIGQLCVVGLDDDRVLVKIVQRGKAGTFDLISNNPEEPPIRGVSIEWAALVNDIKRRR